MRIKLDQTGTPPRLMNRSLNCQTPKTRPRCRRSLLHSGHLPGPRLPVRADAVRAPPSAGSQDGPGRTGSGGKAPSSRTCTPPRQHFRLGKKPGCPEMSMWAVLLRFLM